MYIWRIRPDYARATRGYYASTLIDAFALAHADFPKAKMLICESSDPKTAFTFPATSTYPNGG